MLARTVLSRGMATLSRRGVPVGASASSSSSSSSATIHHTQAHITEFTPMPHFSNHEPVDAFLPIRPVTHPIFTFGLYTALVVSGFALPIFISAYQLKKSGKGFLA